MNVTTKVEGSTLHIMIDVSAKALAAASPSKGGKMNMVASTRGFTGVGLPDGKVLKLSLNAGL